MFTKSINMMGGVCLFSFHCVTGKYESSVELNIFNGTSKGRFTVRWLYIFPHTLLYRINSLHTIHLSTTVKNG